ncbi:MAG: glycosyltransferase family 2 protein [Cytophagales bacterium]|nr:glycosyltransferase family 2 protein [Cytophagales bacterium]
MKNEVLISILNWNSAANTAACIRSVHQITDANYSIVVIDNASKDGSIETLRREFPNLEVIELSGNLGYAAAHREALQYGKRLGFKFLWILNNDLTIRPNALSALLQSHQRNGEAIYGSMVIEASDGDTINFAGGWELSNHGGLDYMTPYNHLMGTSWRANSHTVRERRVSDVNGCSLFIPMEVADKYGFMEDLFFLYKEETDYCFTLMEHRVPSIIVPESIVLHQSGGSFVNHKLKCLKEYYSERNLIIFMKRHPTYFRPYRNPLKTYAPLWGSGWQLIRLWLEGKTQALEFYKHLGIFHAMLGITGKYFKPEKYL